MANRKASMSALVGRTPVTPAGKMVDSEFDVGDIVNVPGDMFGTVKFIGTVKGKAGVFVGVELSREFAARGKNDGDVEGTNYFRTSIPGSGIFLPVHRAELRASPALSFDDFPASPDTPSYAKYTSQHGDTDAYTPPTPSIPKFSQSVGPGVRPHSPQFKPSRPSLSRPESPLRKAPTLAPTPARNFSMSQRAGAAPPRMTASPAPARTGTPRSVSTSRPPPARPYSRNGSRLGHRSDTISENGPPNALNNPRRSPSRQTNPDQEDEIRRLLMQLEEKDRQLKDQANSLAEMDASLREIQALIPTEGLPIEANDNAEIAELREALREKNENIQSLVGEFDAHRADFRSTIDTLELASAETERVYEAKVGDLLAEIHELRELGHNREDVEIVAQQLRSLEELVAELEEGLEDARRGEAEARGEVEFLRGEVERGRSELRREREKAAKALQGAKEVEGMQSRDRDMETKDDEIRGLKAIIHSLSSGPPESASPGSRGSHAPSRSMDIEELERTQASVHQLEREKSELQGLVERKAFREEELECAIEQLRKAAQEEKNSLMSDGAASPDAASRLKPLSPVSSRRSPAPPMAQPQHNEKLWCEVCESEGHDALTCDNISGHHSNDAHHYESNNQDGHDLAEEMRDLEISSQHEDEEVEHEGDEIHEHPSHEEPEADTAAGGNDADKWCALCEKDGHLAFDCPEEL